MNNQFRREVERDRIVVEISNASQKSREKLIRQYREMSEHAFAPETLRSYKRICATFRKWCADRGFSAEPPVKPEVIAEFVIDCGSKIKASTIETRLWAISELHRSNFQPNPCRHRLVELALKSVKRKYGAGVRQAAPLCKKEALEAISRLGDSRLEIRDKAVLWIATDSWCRSCEIVAFKVKDLMRQGDGSSLLFVSRSKTDPFGEGNYAYLSAPGTDAVLRWVELANLKDDDPLITKHQKNAQKTHLNSMTISRIMKRATGRKDISSHSTRVGGVHDAFRIGCDLSSIMVAGRWRSPEMPARYGRRILAKNSAAAQVSDEVLSEVEDP